MFCSTIPLFDNIPQLNEFQLFRVAISHGCCAISYVNGLSLFGVILYFPDDVFRHTADACIDRFDANWLCVDNEINWKKDDFD